MSGKIASPAAEGKETLNLTDPQEITDFCDEHNIMQSLLRLAMREVGNSKKNILKWLKKHGYSN